MSKELEYVPLVLEENELYYITSSFEEEEFPGGVYLVINKQTQVEEARTMIWPQALSYMDAFLDHVFDLSKAKEEGESEEGIVVKPVH
jgi:hypothetical protein